MAVSFGTTLSGVMRDIYEILELCATEDAMDYCSEFDDVKATLEFCNEHVKPFKKLVFRSGNESVINELTRRLQNAFLERHLIDDFDQKPLKEAHQKLRKILMFLFANTDATYKYNLRDDSNFVHLIEICPLLPKFLTVALVWELNLENFFYEALAYTPCWFAFQYFEAANESLKYIEDANKVLSIIEELLRSLLINIERSARLNIDAVDQRIIFNKLYDQAAILLRRFNTPDANVIEKMKKRQLYRYSGYKIKHLLQMVTFAFDLYESKYEISMDFDAKVYTIGEVFHKPPGPKDAIYERTNKEEELRITHTLLSILENCVMSVKMDDFIEWAEVYLTPTMLLQQDIGEMAFHVRERIIANASFEHSVEGILKTIEIQPKPFAVILAEASIGQILRTLEDDTDLMKETKKQWFDELFKRGEETLGNDECLQTIAEHLDLMTTENCEQIIRFIELRRQVAGLLILNEEEKAEFEHEDLILLLLSSLKQFTNESILELLLYQRKIFDESNNAIMIDSEDFGQRATEFLNKCTTVFDLHEFLMLCFEQPQQMWAKFFDSACHSIEQMRHFSETVLKTLPYSFMYVDKLLKEAVLKQTHQPPVYFPELLCEMYFILYRNEHKVDFLAKFINDHMKKCLDAKDYNSLIPIVKALFLISQKDDVLNFDELSAPMLAMVAVVADLSRDWNLNTFSSVRVELVELCTKFITVTLGRLLPIATEKDRKWLVSKLRSTCGPLTQFYFQRILNRTDEIEIPFDRFVCTEDIQDGPKAVKFLHKILVRCTGVEFQSLAGSPRFTPYLTEAMQQIVITVNSDSNPNAILNLSYCLTEYMNAVHEILKPKCQTADEIYELFHGILTLLAPVSEKIYGQVFMETVSLLKDIVLDSTTNLSKDKLTELVNFLVNMPDCTAKNIILQTLKNSISN